MKRSRSLHGEDGALTPALSPGIGGEGWGEGGSKVALLKFIISQVTQ